jgi:hypothetical protein
VTVGVFTPTVTAYPELRAALGGTSAVPDFRGLFLRGYGSQSHTQNNGTTVGVTSTLHASGSLGTVQGDASRNITGYFGTNWRTSSGHSVGDVFYDTQVNARGPDGGNSANMVTTLDTSRVVPTAIEIRPVNTAVRYLIRALP